MQESLSRTRRIPIQGDFNLPEICWVEEEAPVGTKVEAYLTWLHEHAQIQHIMQATRFRNQQKASVLELVIARFLSDISELAVKAQLGKNYHELLRLLLLTKHSKPTASHNRGYRRTNVAAVKVAVEHLDMVPLPPESTLEERWFAVKETTNVVEAIAKSDTSSPEEMLGPIYGVPDCRCEVDLQEGTQQTTIPSTGSEVNMRINPVSHEEVYHLLKTTQITSAVGPDDFSSSLLKYGAGSITEVFMVSLNNLVTGPTKAFARR
ncbi:unnamed protein product [Echinostoma caproni]|uniref:Carrier domain-containing protein n=1 Tax=Echinostoma caproni TaxID=27848 RepID=A0A183B6T5_9TREM|nr:unnamed protein product [Echinostoma caproni]